MNNDFLAMYVDLSLSKSKETKSGEPMLNSAVFFSIKYITQLRALSSADSILKLSPIYLWLYSYMNFDVAFVELLVAGF